MAFPLFVAERTQLDLRALECVRLEYVNKMHVVPSKTPTILPKPGCVWRCIALTRLICTSIARDRYSFVEFVGLAQSLFYSLLLETIWIGPFPHSHKPCNIDSVLLAQLVQRASIKPTQIDFIAKPSLYLNRYGSELPEPTAIHTFA